MTRLRPLLLALVAWALLAGSALAHHNKGLPHYGYFENYPQVPTDDYILVDGKWEVGGVLFNFQGLERSTSDTPNDVKFFVYAYDLKADKTWRGPVTFEVMHEDEVVARWERVQPDQEGVFISRETLPSSGEYELVFRLEEDGKPVELRLPFYVDLAADRVDWRVIGGLAGAVLLALLLAAAGRRKRFARRAAEAV
jgi:hypothetical protein